MCAKSNLLAYWTGHILVFVLISMCFSCSKTENNPNERTYNGVLIDASTDNTLSGVPLRFDEFFGGQSILDTDYYTTDENGNFFFETYVNIDSTNMLIEEQMLDTNVVWQDIRLETMNYRIKSKNQNGMEFWPFRANMKQDDKITVYAWKCGILDLTFMDTIATELYDETKVTFKSKDPDEGYLYRISNPGNQSNDWKISIPADIPIIMSWETYEGPSYDMTEFVRADSLELNFDFKEEQGFVLYH